MRISQNACDFSSKLEIRIFKNNSKVHSGDNSRAGANFTRFLEIIIFKNNSKVHSARANRPIRLNHVVHNSNNVH